MFAFSNTNINADSYSVCVCLQRAVQGFVTVQLVAGVLVPVIVFRVLITGGMVSVLMSARLPMASIQIQLQLQSTVFLAVQNALTLALDQ